MSNVAKLKKKAADLEQKKDFAKALAVYVELLDDFDQHAGELDVSLFNRVGDLMLRQGNVADAVDYYERAVVRYVDGGFYNNAIALCNKILRHSPGRASVYYTLGKISAHKGFTTDAKQNFLEYADRMQKSGNLDEAFRALKEFADLCPGQDDIRLMLADQLSKLNRKDEALEQLQTLWTRFNAEGKESEASAILTRMKTIDPAAEPSAKEGPRSARAGDLVFLDLGDAPASSPRPPQPGGALPRRPVSSRPPPPAAVGTCPCSTAAMKRKQRRRLRREWHHPAVGQRRLGRRLSSQARGPLPSRRSTQYRFQTRTTHLRPHPFSGWSRRVSTVLASLKTLRRLSTSSRRPSRRSLHRGHHRSSSRRRAHRCFPSTSCSMTTRPGIRHRLLSLTR